MKKAEDMMRAVRDWVKRYSKEGTKEYAENELRIFRVTAYKMDFVEERNVNCKSYGYQTLAFTHIYVDDEREFKESDVLIINIPESIMPNSKNCTPIIFHINKKEYLTTISWTDVRDYEGRNSSYDCARGLYGSKGLQCIDLYDTQSIMITLKKAVGYGNVVYEYAYVMDHTAPATSGLYFPYAVAASYGELSELDELFMENGLMTVEQGTFTNGIICLELDYNYNQVYLLFTQERKVSDDTVYGYRARMYVTNKGKAPAGTNLAASANAGVTLGTIIEGSSISGISGTNHHGITLKATSAYKVRYVLYQIRGISKYDN